MKCNALLEAREVPSAEKLAERTSPSIDPMIGVRRLLYRLGQTVNGPLPEGLSHRYTGTAGFLGLLFGLGQLYNHQYRKAVIFASIQIAIVAVTLWSFTEPWNDYPMALLIFWLCIAGADGYITAGRINGTHLILKHFLAMCFAILFFFGAILMLAQYGGTVVFRITTVRSNVMAPALQKGDILFVWNWPVYRRPEPGNIVYYGPGRYTIQQGDVTMILNEMTGFGVISGGPGDSLVVDNNGPLLRNGDPVRPNLLPPVPNGVPGNFRLTVPKDRWAVLPSHGISEQNFLFSNTAPSPREAARRNAIIVGWDEAAIVERDAIWGAAVARIYPPERRTWFGWTGGLWKQAPADYPERRE